MLYLLVLPVSERLYFYVLVPCIKLRTLTNASTQNVLHSWGCLAPAQPFKHLPFLNFNPTYCLLYSLDPVVNLVLKPSSSHPGNRAP